MFEKYTEKAKKVLFLARYEASQMGSKVIGSEHLLLGLIKEGDEVKRTKRIMSVPVAAFTRAVKVFTQSFISLADMP